MTEVKNVNVEALFEQIEYAVLSKAHGMGDGHLMTAKAALHMYMAQRALLLQACETVTAVIERVENRCMAADGPVTPTHEEISDSELQEMFDACRMAQLQARRRNAAPQAEGA